MTHEEKMPPFDMTGRFGEYEYRSDSGNGIWIWDNVEEQEPSVVVRGERPYSVTIESSSDTEIVEDGIDELDEAFSIARKIMTGTTDRNFLEQYRERIR